jgi:hypothetical protein
VLLTSRHRLPIAAAFTLRVPGFSVPNPATSVELSGAVQFFCQEAQRHAAPLTLDSPTLAHIASYMSVQSGVAPCAQTGRRHWLSTVPALKFLKICGKPGRSSLEPCCSNPAGESLRTVFNSSWRQLSAPLQSVYVRCSLCSSFGRSGSTVAGAAAAELIALCDCSLLEHNTEGLLALHPLLREYAAEYALVLGLLAETQRSYMRYWLHRLRRCQTRAGRCSHRSTAGPTDPYLADLQQAWLLAVKAQELDLLAEALPTLERFFG